MQLNLHKNARTTPAIRRELRASTLPVAELARRYNLTAPTVRKWRAREDTQGPGRQGARLREVHDHAPTVLRQGDQLAFQLVALGAFAQPAVWFQHDHLVHCVRCHGGFSFRSARRGVPLAVTRLDGWEQRKVAAAG